MDILTNYNIKNSKPLIITSMVHNMTWDAQLTVNNMVAEKCFKYTNGKQIGYFFLE